MDPVTPPAVPPGFAAAAGFAGPLALRVEHATAGVLAEGELDQPLAVIGSDPRNEVALNDPALPARLACLQVIDGTPTVFPFDTLTPIPLDADTPYSVGPFTLRLTAPPVRRVVVASPAAGLTLEAPNGTGASEFWVLSEPVTFLGRASRCEVRVPDADDVHAYILATADGPWVVDLLGDDGTAVNGERVRAARLLEGDELTVGGSRFVCRLESRGRSPSGPRVADSLRESVPTVGDRRPPGVAYRVADSLRESVPTVGDGRPPARPLPGDPWGDIPIGPRSASPLFSPEPDAAPPPDDLITLTPIPPPTSDQLAGVREQILAEFRHTMGEMTAEFDRMKAEQAAAVNAEVARLAELKSELEALRGKLAGTPAVPPRPAYHPLPEPEEAIPVDVGMARYQWVAARVAALEAERGGIWTRLRGLFGRAV